MHHVGLLDYMMMILLGVYEVVYTFHVDGWSKWCCGLFVSLLIMYKVRRLHMYIALVGLDRDYEKGLIVSWWVLYEVYTLCGVICEACIVFKFYASMYMYMCFVLFKVMWMFTLSVDGVIGHYSHIAPSITSGLLRGKRLKVKERIMLCNAECSLN